MGVDAKTIQIFLPAGQPRGVRIAELTTRIIQVLVVPRTHLTTALTRPEFEHVGVYFLFGGSEDRAKPIVYIGQTEDLRSRLRHHNSNKDFWSAAVIVISRTHSFTQAHIRYLEWHSFCKAREADRYTLDNGQDCSRPFVTEPMEADLLDAFETAATLMSTLGFPVFDPLVSSVGPRVDRELFYCKGPDADATGELVEDGFVVLKGSKARKLIVPSAIDSLAAWREALVRDGILRDMNGTQLEFTEDFLISSPSSASTLVLGRKSNGWIDWKAASGRTLHELKRDEPADPASARDAF